MTYAQLADAPPLLRWLDKAVQRECSDLHLVSGYAPVLRTNGRLVPIDGEAILTSEAIRELLAPIWTPQQQTRMESELNLRLCDRAADASRTVSISSQSISLEWDDRCVHSYHSHQDS